MIRQRLKPTTAGGGEGVRNFIRREIFGRYLTEEERRELSPETKARLEETERMERQSNLALILAVIALLFS